MNNIIQVLVQSIESTDLKNTDILSWGAPVPVFGDISNSDVATLGLNPSNLEFVDNNGDELVGENRRFHTLGSLNIKGWKYTNENHINMIIDSYKNYFHANPYDRWFKSLDVILNQIDYSYYNKKRSACHLDIVPFSTRTKWGGLKSEQKKRLIDSTRHSLASMIAESSVRVLVLNGMSVIDHFSNAFCVDLVRKEMPSWELCKNSKRIVKGYSYTGSLKKVLNYNLNREVLVLGFNHNIQSSFGVTNQVKNSIAKWIKQQTKDAIIEH